MNPHPDKSLGGTFHYDKDGKFIRHDPATSATLPPSTAAPTTSTNPAPAGAGAGAGDDPTSESNRTIRGQRRAHQE